MVFASPQPAAADDRLPDPSELTKLSGPTYPKLDHTLNRVMEAVRTGQVPMAQAAGAAPSGYADRVRVTIRTTGDVDDLIDYLSRRGVTVRFSGPGYAKAYLPVNLVLPVSRRSDVSRVEAVIPPEPHALIGEGAQVHKSTEWNLRGLRGKGVKVGVIDAAFTGFGSLMGTELPADVEVRCYRVDLPPTQDLADCEAPNHYHGTAVSEAIIDIAPDASLYIANMFGGGDLTDAVDWMIREDVDVINVSLGWSWDGPGDGTSPNDDSPLNNVDRAVDAGIIWMNSAGNSARDMWLLDYSDADRNNFLELNPDQTDEFNGVYLEKGEQFEVCVRWDDRWPASVDPTGPGAARDLNLYILGPGYSLVGESNWPQDEGPNHVPLECVYIEASLAGEYTLLVHRYDAEDVDDGDPRWLQFRAFGSLPRYRTLGGSITNPAESANAGLLAVGAARWSNTYHVEGFSSLGPTPDDRTKPDIVGSDGGNSATWGAWYGTSQSSPHLAGMAALVRQRFPDLSPAEVATYLKDNASPRGAEVPNNTWGAGFAELPPLERLPEIIEAQALAPDDAADFGGSVVVSADGDTVVVGAPSDGAGIVYVYTRPEGGWTQPSTPIVLSSPDVVPGDEFGTRVDIDGDTIVVSSTPDSSIPGRTDAIYVFTRPEEGWASTSTSVKLTPPGGSDVDGFGEALSLGGTVVVVGAPDATTDVDGAPAQTGEAFMFLKPQEGWAATSSAVRLAPAGLEVEDRFGSSVSVIDGAIAVGADGSDSGTIQDTGAVYVFTESEIGWASTSTVVKLTASDGLGDDQFGRSVALDGRTVVVGAPGVDLSFLVDSQDGELVEERLDNVGMVYAFTRPIKGTWDAATTTEARLTAVDALAGDNLGASVAVTGAKIVAGAPGAGLARYYEKAHEIWSTMSSGIWFEQLTGRSGDMFGADVAIGPNVIAVTQPGEDQAYVFVPALNSNPQFEEGGATSRAIEENLEPGPVGPPLKAVDPDGDPITFRLLPDESVLGVFGMVQDGDYAQVFTKVSLDYEDVSQYDLEVRVTDSKDNYGNTSDSLFPYSLIEVKVFVVNVDEPGKVELSTEAPYVGDTIDAEIDDQDGWTRSRFWRWHRSADGEVWRDVRTSSNLPSEYAVRESDIGYVLRATVSYEDPQGPGKYAESVSTLQVLPPPIDLTEFDEIAAEDLRGGDAFGSSVAITDRLAVVGAPLSDINGEDSGAVFVFERPESGWPFPAATDRSAQPNDEQRGGDQRSLAYERARALGHLGRLQAENYEDTGPLMLQDREGDRNDRFGSSVAVDGDILVVGAREAANDFGVDAGAVYVFDLSATGTEATIPVAKLTSADGAGGDWFGFSVAIDSDQIVVGAPLHEADDAVPSAGSAYVFEMPENGWSSTSTSAKMTASDGGHGHLFGLSVDVDGLDIAVSAPRANGGAVDAGAVYVLSKPAAGWTSTSTDVSLSSDDATSGGWFGRSVALHGDTLVVGAHRDQGNTSRSGAVYVLDRSAVGWTATSTWAKLTPQDGSDLDFFGFSVDIMADSVVVGSPRADVWEPNQGAVYVFTKPASGWTSTSTPWTLTNHNAGDAWFGDSVATDGSHLLVGESRGKHSYWVGDGGAAFIFAESSGEWTKLRLVSDEVDGGARFGTSLTAEGGTIVVGAPYEDDSGERDAGAVYVFANGEEARLTQPGMYREGDEFGSSVAISEDEQTIVVGSVWGEGRWYGTGTVHVYTRPDGGWASTSESAKLFSSDGLVFDYFGDSVDISPDGQTIVVGAPLTERLDQPPGERSDFGTAYIFDRPDGGWVSTSTATELQAPDELKGSEFARSVAIDGDFIVVGARWRNTGGLYRAGAAYVYERDDAGWATSTPTMLTAPEPRSWDYFGDSVDLQDGTIVVGAPGARYSGAVYIFTTSATGEISTTTPARLYNPTGQDEDRFGSAVAIGGDTVLVGAHRQADLAGTALAFRKVGDRWVASHVLNPSVWDDGQWWSILQPGDRFGISVALDGRTALVGADRFNFSRGSVFGFDLNSPPAFAGGEAIIRSVSENQSAGSAIGSVIEVNDPDGDQLNYSLDGDTDVIGFTVLDDYTLQLVTIKPLDHETTAQYSVTLTASDGSEKASIKVTIEVTDVNEPPMFAEGEATTRSVSENQPAGSPIGSVIKVNDPDGDQLNYSLDGDTDVIGFTVGEDYNTVQLVTKKSLDHDTTAQYSVTLTASDGSEEASINVTIEVTDVNEPPIFSEGESANREVAENASIRTTVGALIEAADPESSDVSYSIARDDAAMFTIDPGSGQLKTAAVFDHETRSSYIVRVSASDGDLASAIEVTVDVLNVDEPGTVNLQVPDPLQVGESLNATLSDPDDYVAADVAWQWYRRTPGTDTKSPITGSTAAHYTTATADAGFELVVEATYTDGHGPGKLATANTGVVTQAPDPDDGTPTTPPDSGSGRRSSDPSPTPVPTVVVPEEEIVLLQTAQDTEVVVVVQPDVRTEVEAPDGSVTVTFPVASMQTTFQARLDTAPSNCDGLPVGTLLSCATIEIFDTQAERQQNVRLISAARIELRISAERVDSFGGAATLLQTHALGGVGLLRRDGPDDPWTEINFEFEISGTEGVTISVGTVRDFSDFALVIDGKVLAAAKAQLGAPTTPAPAPVATPTPAPVTTPAPTPMPVPIMEPETGDGVVPHALLLVLVLAAGLLTASGARLVRSRR